MKRKEPSWGERYVVTSEAGMVQLLSTSLITKGYVFWRSGFIKPGKDPLRVDEKLIRKYGCDTTKWKRGQNRKNGVACIRYLRFEDWFVLLSTKGTSPFFVEENPRDCRESPIVFYGHSISFRGGHGCVRIAQRQFAMLRDFFVDMAARRSAGWLIKELNFLPFSNFKPVCVQKMTLLRAINHKRKAARLEIIPRHHLCFDRRIVRPFD